MFRKIGLILTVACIMTGASFAQYENKKIKVGEDAPELAYPSPAGDTISLRDFAQKKYVIVDFWASWCGPCRRANPGLVEMYKKYKELNYKDAKKGFDIYSVSLDGNKEAWTKAIADDKLEWPTHVSDLKKWQSKAADIYGVGYIPQSFLIGPDGKILGKYMTPEQAIPDLEKYIVVKKKGFFSRLFGKKEKASDES